MKKIRKNIRRIAVFLALNLLLEIVLPTAAHALTGGPSQPEVQSFEPIGTSEMVDLFSGDFTYNIPLLDIEGYPINISYNSGVSMDAEASWVGLGWNINPGVINRNMRGLPDDFDGDIVRRQLNIKDNITVGCNASAGKEIVGLKGLKGNLNASLGIKYNNYKGVGFEQSVNLAVTAGKEGKGGLTGGLGIKSGDEGLTISPSVSYSYSVKKMGIFDNKLGGNVGCSYNSRIGLQAMSFGLNATVVKNSSSLTFGVPTYTPSIGNQMVNGTYTLSIKTGVELPTVTDITGNISGYFSSQRLANQFDKAPAYGYLNLQNGAKLNKVNLDFNRENDGAFSVNTPALPITNLTYDMYSVAGQGIGGTYRLFRSDMGFVFDPYAANTSSSGSMGYELSSGSGFKGGVDLSVTDVNTETNKWSETPAAGRLRFRGTTDDPLYEPAYFREVGEKSVDAEPEYYAKMGGNSPVRFGLETGGDEYVAEAYFVNGEGQTLPVPKENYRTKRQKRNQVITYMTRGEMKRFGLHDQLLHTYNAPDHHIGQVSVVRPDGARYIYGIAAYNLRQEETSFNVGKIVGANKYPKPNGTTGLVRYDNNDNSVSNKRGLDNYYNNTVMPPYAHSYLLTALLSVDYVDIDDVRGPSPGDMGTYTTFSYTKVEDAYKWRTPFDNFQANYNEGLKSDDLDDKGNYIYGEKELWYIDTIKSKNYIAVFTLDARDDGYGVVDRNGGIGEVGMKKLTKISLYSRVDFENSVSPVPIKEVHFEYDYSLCKNIPNQINPGQGKLTLKKIYFTYGNSYKAKYNYYEFTYSDENPDYNLKAQDRWGNYKPNNAKTYEAGDPQLATSEFPYTVQDRTLEDDYASSWNLTEISLPSGGKIKVTYESDDYAYVQNKRAMEMFIVAGVGSEDDEVNLSSLPQNLYNGLYNKRYVFFELKDPLDQYADKAQYKPILHQKYLEGINDLYFRFLVNITGEGGKYPRKYEYVSGYGEIEDYGVSPYIASGDDKLRYGYVKMKGAKRKDASGIIPCHPISKAAWNFGQLQLPKYVFNQSDPDASGMEQLILALAEPNLIRNIFEYAAGTYNMFNTLGYGKTFYSKKSWIRLNSPEKTKLGGGCRVKEIVMSDEWDQMAPGHTVADYGQKYQYTTIDEATGEEISSGVAAYEPGIGSDENPFKIPVYHGDKEERVLAPDIDQYMEEPFGESFFPSASVGYSKVTVQNLQRVKVTRNATGKVVHEFYTAKDFPTITRRTALDAKPYKTNPVQSLFTFNSKDFMTASQGFVVELNDMHGKQKGQKVYAENQSQPISGIEYVYQSKALGKNTLQLDNDATVIHPDGSTSTQAIGVDYDFVADLRSQVSTTVSTSGEFNLATLNVFGVPLPIPTVFPGYTRDETRFRSATTTKVINRAALVKEVIAYDLGARVTTKNLAYDSETGEVLLTQTVNSFLDPVYSFTYPAHWMYDGMGQAYKNIGLKRSMVFNPYGVAIVPNAKDYYVPGDELIANGTTRIWVLEVQDNSISVINELGLAYGGAADTKIIRSGRRNLQAMAVGSFTSLSNPLSLLQSNQFPEVLQASSIIFSDEWKTYCDCFNQESSSFKISTNPYVTGQKGIWRSNRSYAHLTNRSQTLENGNSNIRKDGTFTSFNPFWTWNGSEWEVDENNWTWVTTITQFNPNGQELENVDALSRYSAGIYGYNNTLTVGIGANLRFNEIGFDGFEDYGQMPCSQEHFNFRPFQNLLDNENSHTGKHSIKVNESDNVIITKPTVPCND